MQGVNPRGPQSNGTSTSLPPLSVGREAGVEGIGQEEVETAMHKMQKGNVTGADEVRLEMMEMAGEVESSGQEVHDPGKYRGITLLSQVLELLERVLDAMIRRRVECDF